LADVFESDFQQCFDFFGLFGYFYGEFVVGSCFKECVFDVYVDLGGFQRFMAEEVLHVVWVFRLVI